MKPKGQARKGLKSDPSPPILAFKVSGLKSA